mgnify:CR=1 FL=1
MRKIHLFFLLVMSSIFLSAQDDEVDSDDEEVDSDLDQDIDLVDQSDKKAMLDSYGNDPSTAVLM